MSDDLLWRCSGCRGAFRLLARIGASDLCADCWRKAGEPFPILALSVQEQHENEEAIRRRMTARGGAERHAVRAGRA